jgi:hypothetical protein
LPSISYGLPDYSDSPLGPSFIPAAKASRKAQPHGLGGFSA